MYRKKPDVDVVNDVLLAAMEAYPHSEFVKSLHRQYHERGGLSKKQLEGLMGKASKIPDFPEGKLATLQAIILKKPTRYKSEKPAIVAEKQEKDPAIGESITRVLNKYPQHKRVLFFKSKYDNNENLSPTELAELRRFEEIVKRK
jgi:hypothetical protein